MADFSSLDKPLSCTIKALSDTKKATLNANSQSRVINAATASDGSLDLTLGNLIIKGGAPTEANSKGGAPTEANSKGGGIYVDSNSTLDMKGCTVSDNTAQDGSGVYVSGSIKMTECEISQNTAYEFGGGVYIDSSGEFTMTGGAISENEADSGGGVYVEAKGDGKGKFIMNDSAAISDNKAKSNNGGGVYVGGIFNMTNGTINGNYTGTDKEKINVYAFGGGVYIDSSGEFTMADGAIVDCSAGRGGGVCIATSGTASMHSVTVSGCSAERGSGAYVVADRVLVISDPLFDSANDVYLESGSYIYRNNDSSAYYNPITITPAEYRSGTKVVDLKNYSYQSRFRVTPEESGTKWALNLDGTLMHGEFSMLTEDEIKAGEEVFSGGATVIERFTELPLFFVTSEGVYGVLQCQETDGALATEYRLFPSGDINTFTMNIRDYVDLDTETPSPDYFSGCDLRLNDDSMRYYNGAKGAFLKLAD